MTNYEKLFGTPERVVLTLGAIGDVKPCDEGQVWDCRMCPFDSFDCNNAGTPIDTDGKMLLEWLESEVRDD